MSMNIKNYLNDAGIKFQEKGKNISKGFIGLQCPFCADHSNHLGINLKSGYWNCWICGEKNSNILALIQKLENCSYQKAKAISLDYPSDEIFKDEKRVVANQVWLPSDIRKKWPTKHLDYLKSRNFDFSIIEKYKLMPIGNAGAYSFRILAPVFINHKMVSWQAADIIRDKSRIAYLHCPIEKSIMQLNHCLYNYDSITDKVIIVEGITDVWRLGDGAVATFTKNFTKNQILLLKKKNIKSAFVIYDPDASNKAKELAKLLSGIISHVENIVLKEGDPADMSNKKVKQLKKDLGF